MPSILYNFCLGIIFIICLPKILWQRVFFGKYQGSFRQRIGMQLPNFQIPNKRRPIVWFHCVSVGETRACSTIASQVKEHYHNAYVIISSITETGQQQARREIPYADHFFFLPIDFSWTMKKLVQKIQPDLFLLVETDFWFHLLQELKRSGAKIALINGKISDSSLRKFLLIRPFAKKLFKLFDLLCVQNTHYLLAFQKLGVKLHKIVSTGNLKFDAKTSLLSEQQKNDLKDLLGVKQEDIVITIGSTHEEEEEQILEHLLETWSIYPQLKILLAPRHPERFSEVRDLLKKKRISFFSFSNPSDKTGFEKVVLMDRMGILNDLYQISVLAIVAGSFSAKVGGHNIFEPLEFGTPVLYGPYMHQQKSLDSMVAKIGAGKKLQVENLSLFITQFLDSPAMQMTMRSAAWKLREDAKGSAKRSWEYLQHLIDESAPEKK